ncbi:MAG TPA: FAD-binding oxidoreductase, partial [Nevskiaceae bacterium]|nr:FAD-binding oxidoreductase [Nevskiaceae bacterium]
MSQPAVSKLSSGLQAALASAWLRPLNDATALDEVLSWIDPALTLATIKARVGAIIDETADTKTFVLQPNRHWRGHAAGQHVQVQLDIRGVRTQRTYTISSAPGGDGIAITVKRQGRFSTHLHERVRVGDVLTLSAAAGNFVLPDVLPEKILMISGGSGITPVMAMLRELAARRY